MHRSGLRPGEPFPEGCLQTRLPRRPLFCVSPWEWLCSSCALRSKDIAQEADGNVSSPASHPQKGSRFLLQLLSWAEGGGGNNKRKRVGGWKNTFRPLTHCEHITSGVEWVMSLLKYQSLMPAVNLTLHGEVDFVDMIKLQTLRWRDYPQWCACVLNAVTKILIWERQREFDTDDKAMWTWRQRWESCGHEPRSASSHQELEEANNGFSLRAGSVALWAPWFWPSETDFGLTSLKICERIHFCLRPSSLWSIYYSRREKTNALTLSEPMEKFCDDMRV